MLKQPQVLVTRVLPYCLYLLSPHDFFFPRNKKSLSKIAWNLFALRSFSRNLLFRSVLVWTHQAVFLSPANILWMLPGDSSLLFPLRLMLMSSLCIVFNNKFPVHYGVASWCWYYFQILFLLFLPQPTVHPGRSSPSVSHIRVYTLIEYENKLFRCLERSTYPTTCLQQHPVVNATLGKA